MPVENSVFDIQLTTRFHTVTYPAGATYGPRRLETFEFVWMLEGEAAYSRDGITVIAPEGSFVLCRPSATDFFRWDPRRPTRHAYFHFTLRGELPPEWPHTDDWPLVRQPAGGDDLLPILFRNLLAWGDSSATGDAQTRHVALSLLAAFVTGRTSAIPAAERSDSRLPEAVRLALGHIDRRLQRGSETGAPSLTLDELAGVAAVTPEHLCRLFRSATGKSPLETVRLQRLERARTLLLRTNYSVSEIAALCGFASPFHFSRRFKAVYGDSPRALRERNLL